MASEGLGNRQIGDRRQESSMCLLTGASWIVMALAGTSATFPRKRLVRDFTNRLRGNALYAADKVKRHGHDAG
jgi:hypothetical protein